MLGIVYSNTKIDYKIFGILNFIIVLFSSPGCKILFF